jgi:hypothetical protein
MGRSILFTIIFIALVAATLFGLLMLLVGGKEGAETIHLILGACISISLLVIWWSLSKYFITRYQKVLSISGRVILSFVAFAYTTTSVPYVINYFKGPTLAKKIRIENFQETPIVWPGFDGPVGIRLDFDLLHPKITGNLLQPTIWMGPQKKMQSDWVYSFDQYYLYDGVYPGRNSNTQLRLSGVLFPVAPRGSGRLDGPIAPRRSYALFPTTVSLLENPSKLCLKVNSYSLPSGDKKTAIFHDGENLSSVWYIAGPANLRVDLSEHLTEKLRHRSFLQNNPEEWRKIHKRWEPDGLIQAGYQPCKLLPKDLDRNSGRQCYCR